jgi:integrase
VAWKSVSKDKYLYQRGNSYYVRRRVPIELRGIIGKEFLIASLKTGDFKEASRLANYVNKDHQTLLDDAAGRLFPAENNRKLDDIPAGEIEQMVLAWFANSNRASAVAFAREDLSSYDFREQSDLKRRQQELTQKFNLLSLPDDPSHDELLAPIFNHLITSHGLAYRYKTVGPITLKSRLELVANRTGYKYRLFADIVRRAYLELLRQEIAQLGAVSYVIDDPELKDAINPPSRRAKRTVTLGELIEEFKGDPNRKSMRKKVELDYSLLFRVMDEVIGFDRRLKDIDRNDCRAVRELLMKLPSNATKLYRGMTFSDAAEQGATDGRAVLSGATVNSYLHKMSALFNYAVAEERMDKNPARKLGLEGFEHNEDDRRPFSNEQLEKIFSAPIFVGCENDGRGWSTPGPNRPKGAKFWVPLIGLYQGMRLNEICQLGVGDFDIEGGIAFFHVRPTENGNRVKTDAGRRKVPLHPRLEGLGFVEFHRAQKKRQVERLFPDLKRDSRGYYSDGFQKWFSRLIERQTASQERTSFHSFRHNWRDAMRNAGVPQERVRLIGGWKRTATDEQYGSNLPLSEVRKEIAKVIYSDVKALSAL